MVLLSVTKPPLFLIYVCAGYMGPEPTVVICAPDQGTIVRGWRLCLPYFSLGLFTVRSIPTFSPLIIRLTIIISPL